MNSKNTGSEEPSAEKTGEGKKKEVPVWLKKKEKNETDSEN